MRTSLVLLLVVLFVLADTYPTEQENGAGYYITHDLDNELIQEKKGQHAWETSGQFEGDMILSRSQMNAVLEIGGARNGIRSNYEKWPNNVVPYLFNTTDLTRQQMDFIEENVQEFSRISCITIRPWRETDVDFVYISARPDRGCSSAVGRQGGLQNMNLASNVPYKGCFKPGTIQHEFLHALGFYHQHSAADRDEHIIIEWNNIIDDRRVNFKKYASDVTTSYDVPYDYNSVMHYSNYAFTKNDEVTILPRNREAHIGQRDRLSEGDIRKLNAMYCNRQCNS